MTLSEIFNFPKQNSFKKRSGYVKLEFHDKNNEIEVKQFYNNQTLLNIKDLLARGYSYKDICIIVRKKKEGVLIGDHLTDNGIPIISSEVLNLSSSSEVIFIINLICYQIENSDFNKVNFCKSLCELNFVNLKREDFLIEILEKEYSEIKQYITIDGFDFEFNNLNKTSIYEAIEYIIDSFGLLKESNSYIQFFLDFTLDYSNKFQTGLSEFVEYFEEKKEKLNIINPQGINAVEIITIHKSKGLEFPIVIYPYADINIKGDLNPKTWINLKNSKDISLKKSLVNINKDLEKIDNNLYNNYRWKLEIDNINLLYVALTRAKKELYIISEKNLDSRGNEKTNYFSGIFISYLKNIGVWKDTECSYEFGVKDVNKIKNLPSKNITQEMVEVNSRLKQNIIINSKNTNSWINEFDSAQEEGHVFHQIMEEIKSEKDIIFALNRFYELGFISLDIKKVYEKKIFEIINHPDLKKYYNNNLVSYNEREIISKNGYVVIPDRLVFLTDLDLVIIDYKTGAEDISHVNQLEKYQAMLEEMDFNVNNKIIVYIAEKIKIKFC